MFNTNLYSAHTFLQSRPSAAQQSNSRQTMPSRSGEAYMKPGVGPSGPHAMQDIGPPPIPVEPWADALDEIDPRELAMQRFRARHEILAELFGSESISEQLQCTCPYGSQGLIQCSRHEAVGRGRVGRVRHGRGGIGGQGGESPPPGFVQGSASYWQSALERENEALEADGLPGVAAWRDSLAERDSALAISA